MNTEKSQETIRLIHAYDWEGDGDGSVGRINRCTNIPGIDYIATIHLRPECRDLHDEERTNLSQALLAAVCIVPDYYDAETGLKMLRIRPFAEVADDGKDATQ